MRHDLEHDKAVVAIAAMLKAPKVLVFGALFRFWRWADLNSSDGDLGVSRDVVDYEVGVPGFAGAMISVGWLVEDDGRVCVPKFDRYLGKTREQQIRNTAAKAKSRECHESSGHPRDIDGTKACKSAQSEDERVESVSINQRAGVRERAADRLFQRWCLWAGRDLTVNARRAAADMAIGLDERPPRPDTDALAFVEALMDNVTENASYVNEGQAEKYLRGVINRCRRDGCLPGEFAEHPAPRGGGARVERDYAALARAGVAKAGGAS